jgi:hypothetical protein
MVLTLRMKKLLSLLCLLFLLTGRMGVSVLWADPLEKVGPDQSLYQRVRNLGHAGLLDARDQSVLDQGVPLTRLQLAFYVEKARARLQDPPPYTPAPTATAVAEPAVETVVPTPAKKRVLKKSKAKAKPTAVATAVPTQVSVVTENPTPILEATQEPTAVPVTTEVPTPVSAVTEAPTPVPTVAVETLVPTPMPTTATSPAAVSADDLIQPPPPPATTPVVTEAVTPQAAAQDTSSDSMKKEIKDLLKELRQEDALLKNRLHRDERLNAKASAENAKLKPTLDQWDKIYRKSDKSSGSTNMTIETGTKFENMHVSGVTVAQIYHSEEYVNIMVNSDINGRGAFSAGVSASLPMTNGSAAAASIGIFAPKLSYNLDGKLGHWENKLTIEDYLGDTDLGTFARGSDSSNRYERPFEIKNYSTDKNQKCWDDYITNLGYVASADTFATGSNSSRVFDGLLLKGSNLPLVGHDDRLTLLLGPTGSTVRSEWEEGAKYSRSWFHSKINTNFSTLWVNDHLGDSTAPSMNLKTYTAEVGLNVLPVYIDLEGAASGFETGVDTQATGAIKPVWDKALQATCSYYPFSLFGTWVGPDFSNTQSKATITGIDYTRFGYTSSSSMPGKFGYVGFSDSVMSDRYGGRINLGWKGRQSAWMKSWPKFLDAFILNADAALRREQRSVTDPLLGQNTVVADWLVNVYTPDGTGVWGSNVWGKYGTLDTVGKLFFENIDNERNMGVTHAPDVGMGTTEYIPMILPVLGSNGLPVTNASGHFVYTNLTHQKTYRYLTGTLKVQFNKLFDVSRPIYGGFFFTDHKVSGSTSDATLAAMADPNRPGQTLARISDLFTQRVWDAALMVNTLKYVNLMGDYGVERWMSQYTYPQLDRTTKSIGAGLAYDFPWGGGKFEIRYKHLTYKDVYVAANNFQANQTYATLIFKF